MMSMKVVVRASAVTFIVIVLLAVGIQIALMYTPVGVYGQADYTSNAANRNGDSGADTLSYPLGITLDSGGGIYVADRNNHRVLYFANDGDTSADRVYGQYGDFAAHIANNNGSGDSGAPSPDNLNMPTAVALDSAGGLYVTDRDNHRVLYFANDGNTTADRVLGQADNYGTNMVNNDGTNVYGEPSATNFGAYILGVAVDSQDGLYVSDTSNHRVLYFANDGDEIADRVYGQWDNFTTDTRNNDGSARIGAPNANSLNFPRGLAIDASDGLYIADRDNSRILYFANDGDTTADRVFGQFGDFTTNVESNDGQGNVGVPSANNLAHPKDMAVGPNGGLYVSDSNHNRILYFANDGDTTADGVGGQFGSWETVVINNDGNGGSGAPSGDNLNAPQGITVAPNGDIYVNDTGNNRLLLIQCPDWQG
jgi:hypothetical protein